YACILLISACAGPMDPFGAKPILNTAIDQLQNVEVVRASSLAVNIPNDDDASRMPASTSNAEISFFPPRKLWHRSFDLSITIKDHAGLNANSRIVFYYAGEDITSRIMNIAHIKYSGDGSEVKFTIPAFRLLPEQDK